MYFKDVHAVDKEKSSRSLLRTIYRIEWLAISIIAAVSVNLIYHAFGG